MAKKKMSTDDKMKFFLEGVHSDEELDGIAFTHENEHGEALEAGYVDVDDSTCHEEDSDLVATKLTALGRAFLGLGEVGDRDCECEDTDEKCEPCEVEELSHGAETTKKKHSPHKKHPVMFSAPKTIALPERVYRNSNKEKGSPYPFDALELGQTFFVPDCGDQLASKFMAGAVHCANKRSEKLGLDKKFVSRYCGDGKDYAEGYVGVSGAVIGRVK